MPITDFTGNAAAIMEALRLDIQGAQDAVNEMRYVLEAMRLHTQALQDYVSNGFVFVVWGTLALLFIMAIAFYFMFRRPRR